MRSWASIRQAATSASPIGDDGIDSAVLVELSDIDSFGGRPREREGPVGVKKGEMAEASAAATLGSRSARTSASAIVVGARVAASS